MNTFFFGQRAQKERVEDVGKVHKLPLKRMAAFDYFTDTLRVAMIGQLSKGQGDLSLVVATRDTAKERKERKERIEKRSEEHTSELQSRTNLVCRLLLEKKNT